jgi:hypothetical protein
MGRSVMQDKSDKEIPVYVCAQCGWDIDWEAIEDRTRELHQNSHWASPIDILKVCVHQYQEDKWREQPNKVEVWIEKDALLGVIEPTCRALDVPWFSCRGYVSQSEMYVASLRIRDRGTHNQRTVILHLGDHDPSGIDMTRDITDRLTLMTQKDMDVDFAVRRIALTKEQIDKYDPPPNPAKTTDSRYASYIDNYGKDSWELDALDPKVIAALIKKETQRFEDKKIRQKAVLHEQASQDTLGGFVDQLQEQAEEEEDV